MAEERQRRGRPRAATNPLGTWGLRPHASFLVVNDATTSFPPRASPGTRKPHVRDPSYDSDTLLEADAVSPRPLRPVQRLVGAPHQRLDVVAVLRERGDPDADGHFDRDAVERDGRRLDGPADALRRPQRLVGGAFRKVGQELLPSIPGRDVV